MTKPNIKNKTNTSILENLISKMQLGGHVTIKQLTPHGSAREYFLIKSKNNKYIGTIGSDATENKTFVKMAKHLNKQGINVPEVIVHDKEYDCYIQTYCGNTDLFSYIKKAKQEKRFKTLCPAIDLLHEFQNKGSKGWNFKHSYPYEKFDKEEILRDSKRFTQRFLKHIPIKFSSKLYNKDIEKLVHEIDSISQKQYVLMHRDFQSRNILVHNKKHFLIDFQGARKGPMHYDLASLLFQSQVSYNNKTILKSLEYFVSKKKNVDTHIFLKHFYHIVLVRLIQTLGAYGIIGIEQQKPYFIKSIPFALRNINKTLIILNKQYGSEFKELESIIDNTIKYYDTRI